MIVFDELIDANLGALTDARKRFRRMLDDLRFPVEFVDYIEMALAEGASNPIIHGTPKPSKVQIILVANSRGVELTIADNAGAFTEFDTAFARAAVMPDVLSEDGRGLALMREGMDKVQYVRNDDWNVLTLFRRYKRAKLRVLIAEDSDATLAFFEAILSGRFELHTATSVEELSQKFNNQIDLVIADIHLGDGKSSDFLAALERNGEGPNVPLILVTSDTSEQVVKDAVRLGTETVLVKPVRPKALLDAIDKTLAARARQRVSEARHFNKMIKDIVGKPDFSKLESHKVAFRMGTAATGGGDLLLDLGGTTRRRLILADLMGHGTSALARSATWVGLFHGVQVGLENSAPSEIVDRFSAALLHGNLPEHVTGTFLVIDLLSDNRIEMASAGHPSPLLLDGDKVAEISVPGVLPGISDKVCAITVSLALERGQRLLAATDGIDPDNLAYRISIPKTVRDAALLHSGKPLEATITAMAVAQETLTGYRPEDDWTMLMIEAGETHPAS